jgi:hypothetical protein
MIVTLISYPVRANVRRVRADNGQQLERHVAIELLVVRAEHDAHAASAEFLGSPM